MKEEGGGGAEGGRRWQGGRSKEQRGGKAEGVRRKEVAGRKEEGGRRWQSKTGTAPSACAEGTRQGQKHTPCGGKPQAKLAIPLASCESK